MNQNLSFRERVARLWSGKTQESTTEDDLKKVGLTFFADKKFAERQDLLKSLLFRLAGAKEEGKEPLVEEKTPKEQAKALRELLNDVHIGIHMLAAPYYQTLDNVNYHRLMRGWSALHALGTQCITTVEARIKSVEKKEPNNNSEGQESENSEMTENEETEAEN